MAGRDWAEWHQGYDVTDSTLARRLAVVRERIGAAVATEPDGPIRLVSVCAGEGRDVMGALTSHPRRTDVVGRLVEADADLVANAVAAADAAGLPGIEVLLGDAGLTDSYAGAVPADLVLVCGVFGNLTDADIERTIAYLPALCGRGATVIWTRHRRSPDLVPVMCGWFARSGYVLEWLSDPGEPFGVGVHRFVGSPADLPAGERMFSFGAAATEVTPMSGRVVHFEIPADDLERARVFYRDSFGWQLDAVPQLNYTLVTTTPVDGQGQPTEPGAINGGMLQRGSPVTGTVITVEVDDIDQALTRIEELGGKTVLGRQAVGEIGFSAYFSDTEGNVVGLWENAALGPA